MSAGLGDTTLFDCGMCHGTGRIVNAWIAMHEDDYVDEQCRACDGEGENPDRLTSSAALSPDGIYRYNLTRTWGAGPIATFLMLNPSTADADVDDPTIRRCLGFAKSWGCSSLRVANVTRRAALAERRALDQATRALRTGDMAGALGLLVKAVKVIDRIQVTSS